MLAIIDGTLMLGLANIDGVLEQYAQCASSNRHVGFGFGGHTCLGIHLARMEMIALWKEIIPRLKSVELTGTPRMAESEFVCGPKTVPIRFEVEKA